ncbi:MAG: hypothetical protein AAFU56_03750, partial [Pseudomonadota bacterium]
MDTLLEIDAKYNTGMSLTGGRILGPDGIFLDADLHMDAGIITETAPVAPQVINVSDCLILPGIVDAHGDWVELLLLPGVFDDFAEWVSLRMVVREL